VQELVAYGLVKEQAPSLNHSKAVHLEADSFHQMMTEDNTVIIDVRNFYESNIGHFAPPEGGAELIDPKMRNSHEFPKWLNTPETKEKLKGKKVRIYTTSSGIYTTVSRIYTARSRIHTASSGIHTARSRIHTASSGIHTALN
jgi:predicted sulfurtransferase